MPLRRVGNVQTKIPKPRPAARQNLIRISLDRLAKLSGSVRFVWQIWKLARWAEWRRVPVHSPSPIQKRFCALLETPGDLCRAHGSQAMPIPSQRAHERPVAATFAVRPADSGFTSNRTDEP